MVGAKETAMFRRMRRLFNLYLVCGLFLFGCQSSSHPSAEAPAQQGSRIVHPEIGFSSSQKLQEHFEKHGGEFGAKNKQEYLQAAQVLRDSPVGGDILELSRTDGVITRFDRRTGAFLAYNRD